uniref:Uncharacterized protein n=1 Tax=Arundo donax TaxID=35708 RepID=A0A0A9EVW5_ARUDO
MKVPVLLKGLNAPLRTANVHFQRNPIWTSMSRRSMSSADLLCANSLAVARSFLTSM